PILAGALELADDLREDIVLYPHVVRRAVAARAAIEIRLAHIERVAPGGVGDVVNHALGKEHALRAAETAEGGVRYRIGAHPPAENTADRIEIGVVGVEHGAVDHPERQVLGMAAARGESGIDGADHPILAEADAIVDAEIVTLPRHHHVV